MGLFRRHRIIGNYHQPEFWLVYPLSIIFVMHTMMVAYINSTYMEKFISTEGVGALFTIGSAISVLAFLFFSYALRAIGNVKLTLILALLDILSLIAIGAADTKATAIVAFVTFLVINPLLFLNIDIFSETIIGNNETTTGSKRGLSLGLMSLAGVIAPLLMGVIVDGTTNLNSVYFYAAGMFVPFLILIIWKFKSFTDPHYPHLKVTHSIRRLWKTPDIRNVMLAHLTLQLFFTWAVIYIPLYLATEIGLPWDVIGVITAVGLSAYVLLEWPIGLIADRYIGEKEIMALGFVILAVSLSWLAFMHNTEPLGWMILVFITRVGASMVEATTESYFFKHTQGNDAETIGFYRLLRPLATIIGSLAGSAALLYLPFNLIFVVFGLLMVPGIFFTVALHDTK